MSQIDPLRHAGYIQNQLKTPGRLEAFMNRLVLFAVLLFQSSLIFCQSTAIPARSAQVPGKESMGQGPFRFSNGQPGQNTARRTFKSFDCHSPNATQNQANVPIDFDHLFNAPYMDLKSRVDLFALNENSSSWSPLVIGPHPRGEPIPTQWPHAKIERIPTQWPNLKLQPVDGISPGVVPVQGSAK